MVSQSLAVGVSKDELTAGDDVHLLGDPERAHSSSTGRWLRLLALVTALCTLVIGALLLKPAFSWTGSQAKMTEATSSQTLSLEGDETSKQLDDIIANLEQQQADAQQAADEVKIEDVTTALLSAQKLKASLANCKKDCDMAAIGSQLMDLLAAGSTMLVIPSLSFALQLGSLVFSLFVTPSGEQKPLTEEEVVQAVEEGLRRFEATNTHWKLPTVQSDLSSVLHTLQEMAKAKPLTAEDTDKTFHQVQSLITTSMTSTKECYYYAIREIVEPLTDEGKSFNWAQCGTAFQCNPGAVNFGQHWPERVCHDSTTGTAQICKYEGPEFWSLNFRGAKMGDPNAHWKHPGYDCYLDVGNAQDELDRAVNVLGAVDGIARLFDAIQYLGISMGEKSSASDSTKTLWSETFQPSEWPKMIRNIRQNLVAIANKDKYPATNLREVVINRSKYGNYAEYNGCTFMEDGGDLDNNPKIASDCNCLIAWNRLATETTDKPQLNNGALAPIAAPASQVHWGFVPSRLQCNSACQSACPGHCGLGDCSCLNGHFYEMPVDGCGRPASATCHDDTCSLPEEKGKCCWACSDHLQNKCGDNDCIGDEGWWFEVEQNNLGGPWPSGYKIG